MIQMLRGHISHVWASCPVHDMTCRDSCKSRVLIQVYSAFCFHSPQLCPANCASNLL